MIFLVLSGAVGGAGVPVPTYLLSGGYRSEVTIMAKLSPREVAEKQVRKAQAASEDYIRGVRSVTESPMAKAVSKKEKFKNNLMRAIDSGKWENNTAAVPMEEWARKTETVGAPRYSEGVGAALEKTVAFQEEFLPFVRSVQEKVNSMPDATPEQRIAKMVENAKSISKFQRMRRRR